MWSEIESNLSSKYYSYKPQQLAGWVRLRTIASIDPARRLDYNQEFIDYVGLAETDNLAITTILRRPYSEVKGRRIIKNSDILFARIEPSIFNKKYILVNNLQNYTLASTEFNIIQAKNSDDAKYILYMLLSDMVYKQFLGKLTGSTGRRRLDKTVLKNIWIPYPQKETRQQIVSIMDKAFQTKAENLRLSNNAFKSIDIYLLQELNLKLPVFKEELSNRKFIVASSDLIGNRIDPSFHAQSYKIFIKNCKRRNINLVELDNICETIFQGVGRQLTDNPKCTLLKVKNIEKRNIINYDDIEYIDNPPQSKRLKVGDIISPFIGEAIRQFKFSKFDKDAGEYFVDNNTGVIRVSKAYNNDYICAILNSSIVKFQIERLIGGGVPFMGSNAAKQLLIPITDKLSQDKIAKKVNSIYKQIRQNELKAKLCIDDALKEIESIISEL